MGGENLVKIFGFGWAAHDLHHSSTRIEHQKRNVRYAIGARKCATFNRVDIRNQKLEILIVERPQSAARLPLQSSTLGALRIVDLHNRRQTLSDLRQIGFADSRLNGFD